MVLYPFLILQYVMVELAVGREVFRKHVGDGASHTCHPDGQLPRSPPDSPRLGWQHQWVSNACLLVKIVTHSWCRFWSHFLVQRNTAEAIFKPNLLQTLGGGRRRRRRGLKEVLVRVSGENKSSSICIRMSLQPALVHAKGEKGWVEGAIIAADSQADIDKPQTAPGRAVAQVSLFPQCGLAGAWDQWGPSFPPSPRGDLPLVQAPTQFWGTPTDCLNAI